MEPYFKTTIEVEDLSNDDILILQKNLKIYNLVIKIVKYVLLIVIVLFVFLFLSYKYNNEYSKNIDFFMVGYNAEITIFLFFITIFGLIFGMVCTYLRFVFEQALKNNYVVVCTGVLTREYFFNGFHILIGTIRLAVEGYVKKALKVGTCVQCRFFGTTTKSYCISMKRYNEVMYNPEHILQVEDKDLELDLDILMMYAMLEEIVNYQMFQVKMGKKDGIKGILLAIVCRMMNPFYMVEYDKEQGNTVKKPDLSDFKNKLNKNKNKNKNENKNENKNKNKNKNENKNKNKK